MSGPDVEVRLLGPDDAPRVDGADPGLFDGPVVAARTREVLADPRHHLVGALEGGSLVGFVSAVHYLHPDKPPELFVNEVGVRETHRRRGLARRMLAVLLEHGRALGCVGAWVLSDGENEAAHRLYAAAGGVRLAAPAMHAFALEGGGEG